MSILVDANEPTEFDYLLRQMGIEVRRDSYNQTAGTDALPDFQVLNGSWVGVNRKQAVEAMADLDKVEDQLRRELRVCENLVFVYEGALTWAEEGTYAGDAEHLHVKHRVGRQGAEYEDLASRGRVLHQPFARWTSFIWRLQGCGIPVVGTGNIRGTAAFLHTLHNGHTNNLFTRLIETRRTILEEDPRLRQWLLFLMGIPGVGEEVAKCIAQEFSHMWELIEYYNNGGSMAEFELPRQYEDRKPRKLGPALDKRIRGFLGVDA